MNSSEKPRGMATISSEALIGIGITVAWLGIMCLLLAWAEQMRAVPGMALIWFVLGVALVGVGGIAAFSARSRDSRPARPDRPAPSDLPPDETESEPEEQRI